MFTPEPVSRERRSRLGYHELAGHWAFKEEIVFLNHGSFGACPVPVQQKREDLLRRIESDPMEFMLNEYQPLLASALKRITEFMGAQPGSVVFVENSTTGINTILRNLPLGPGDEILVADQEYFSSSNSLEVIARGRGATVRLIHLPFPVESPEEIIDAFAEVVSDSTKYALVDHIVSSTGMIMPLKMIIDTLSGNGVKTIVDGAHGPGQVPLNLKELGCFAYVGNCHKWLCSPRSSASLYVHPDFQDGFLPLVISHIPGDMETDLSDFQMYFRWNGTPDPTPALCVPESLKFMEELNSSGWPGIMQSNREKSLQARQILCAALEEEPPCPDFMVGAMAAIPLEGFNSSAFTLSHFTDPLQKWLKNEKGIVVPITSLCNGAQRMVRISAQQYNSIEQYHYLAEALVEYRKKNY